MDTHIFLIQLLNGIQYGLLLFLVASGLTLIFGIMGVINLSHGSFYMVGAYLAWSLTQHLGSFWIALPAGILLSVALGMLLEWLFIRHLYRRDHLQQVLLTYGLILSFSELRSILWGDDVHSVAVPTLLAGSIPLTEILSYPVYRLWLSLVCVILAGLMYYLIQHTKLGMMIRAGASIGRCFATSMNGAIFPNRSILRVATSRLDRSWHSTGSGRRLIKFVVLILSW